MAEYQGRYETLQVYRTTINNGYGSDGEPAVHFAILNSDSGEQEATIDLTLDQAELLLVQLMKAVCA